ncbi:MAG TPA: OadG family protein [Bacillota bacterium]|nr:OadG family protein [Bacillota bacterium]HOA15060.1 OadG family protein [Bacillota bacterium]HOG52387.1 OadG family protein [Bacillota bacterium]
MENLELGLYTTGMGMFIVFLGLVFLMYIMIGLALVDKGRSKKKATPSKGAGIREQVESLSEDAPVEDAGPAKMEGAAPAQEAAAGGLGEVAAIAAVMAILTSEGVHGVVTSVRQVGSKVNSWAFAGRRDIMASRL